MATSTRHGLAAALIGLVATGCSEGPSHPSLAGGKLPPLVQASAFVPIAGEPRGYMLSPDGAKLAWIGPRLGRSTLFVRDNASGATRGLTRLSAFEHWTADGRWILWHGSDPSGAENSHVYALDTEAPDPKPVNLTPYPGVRARIHALPEKEPGQVLVTHNRRDGKLFDLVRIEIATGVETVVSQNPGDAVAPLTDARGALRAWQRPRDAKRLPEERAIPLAERERGLRKRTEETFRVLGRSHDGSVVWALSSRGRDRVALVAAHPTLGWERVELEDPHADVEGVDMSRVQRVPLIARVRPGHPRFEILDAKLREDLAPLVRELGDAPASLDIVSADGTEERMVIVARSATNRRYYLVDRAQRTHTLLSRVVPASLEAALVPTEPIEITASDGTRLPGYLTLPAGVAPKQLPLVLHVHGGPWLRTGWGDPRENEDAIYAQLLANRGYAVLQVDFRGSTGLGQRHFTAGNGEVGGRMQSDLTDAVRWAVDRGLADPQRVAFVGWSFGSYASLLAATTTPTDLACAVSLNGPTDLASLIESFPAYWQVDLSLWHDFAGNPAVPADRERLAQRSPLTHAARAARPILMIHGANDVRVRVDQADRMVVALRAADRPVEYLRIEDMGHGTGWWVHRLAVLRATERFLAPCLGGRASRFDPWDTVARVWTAWR